MSPFYPEPADVAQLVDEYVARELHDAESYSNREPLDESSVWSLHRLAAEIYANGWKAGHIAGSEQHRQARRREKDRA